MSAAYSRLLVHLVWATWDRRPVFDERRARRVHGRLAAICRTSDCCALAVGGVADHVHLLVSLHQSVAVSTLVQRLKVGTSQFVAHELSVPGFAWQGGYGAFSVGDAERDAVHTYVSNQRRHHDEGTTRDPWEQTTVNPATAGLPLP